MTKKTYRLAIARFRETGCCPPTPTTVETFDTHEEAIKRMLSLTLKPESWLCLQLGDGEEGTLAIHEHTAGEWVLTKKPYHWSKSSIDSVECKAVLQVPLRLGTKAERVAMEQGYSDALRERFAATFGITFLTEGKQHTHWPLGKRSSKSRGQTYLEFHCLIPDAAIPVLQSKSYLCKVIKEVGA